MLPNIAEYIEWKGAGVLISKHANLWKKLVELNIIQFESAYSRLRSLFFSDFCFVVVSMCSPVDWAVEETPYSTEDLIVEDNDGFSGPEVDTGGWLDETTVSLIVVDVGAWLEFDVCRLCVAYSVDWVTDLVVT